MPEALCEHLLEKPDSYQGEMVVLLWDEFRVLVTIYSIGRALASVGWSKKAARRIARRHNIELLSSHHLVFPILPLGIPSIGNQPCDHTYGLE